MEIRSVEWTKGQMKGNPKIFVDNLTQFQYFANFGVRFSIYMVFWSVYGMEIQTQSVFSKIIFLNSNIATFSQFKNFQSLTLHFG